MIAINRIVVCIDDAGTRVEAAACIPFYLCAKMTNSLKQFNNSFIIV